MRKPLTTTELLEIQRRNFAVIEISSGDEEELSPKDDRSAPLGTPAVRIKAEPNATPKRKPHQQASTDNVHVSPADSTQRLQQREHIAPQPSTKQSGGDGDEDDDDEQPLALSRSRRIFPVSKASLMTAEKGIIQVNSTDEDNVGGGGSSSRKRPSISPGSSRQKRPKRR